ncbi:MAG TPA: penicillin-binding protein 2 [Patescibacteria group bacterium]|nr:penicillin-binding protein 2 [Patescibacteria group bacterium]
MIHDNDHSKVIGRRSILLGGGKAVLLSALVGRMYYLQVMQADKYATLAEQNRINLRLLPPPRGRILDRNGLPMAVNQPNYRVLVVSENTDDLDDTLDSLARIIPLNDRDRSRIVHEAERHRSFVPVAVKENLSWEEVARIELNSPDLPGVAIDVGQSRAYPLVGLGAHLLGYVSAVSEADVHVSSDPLLELPGFRVGKAGVEKFYDLGLRGKGGVSQVEVDSIGRTIRELQHNDGEPGQDLSLTIDLDLQRFASQRLGEESGSVVVMDIFSGEVLVMASQPSFDPNAFNRGLTTEEWKDLITNPRAPLTNKAISGQYPPGSTFKTMVALAALESGAITKDHSVDCQGKMTLGNFTWYCDKRHGVLDLERAIQQSCDVYFYDVARRIGIDTIAEMAKKFGLGSRLDIDLPNESPGLVPTRAWKRATYGVPWTPGEDFNAGIGQGYLQVTPLQMAVMAARLANGGMAVRPHLAHLQGTPQNTDARSTAGLDSLGVSHGAINTVLNGMIAVTTQPGGTAYAARIMDPAMAMAGKTGTAQVHHLSFLEHHLEKATKPQDLPWKLRDHAMFIAYAPISEPRYACAVVVEHGGWGASTAAPIARDVLIEVQKRYPPQTASTTPLQDHDHDHAHAHG